MKNLICPISDEVINERLTRINACIVILLVAAGFFFNSGLIFIFLMSDFFIRAFTKSKHSPVSYAGRWIVQLLHLKNKSVNKAPKIFAARMGFLMALTVTVLFLLKLYIAAYVVASLLVFFALLEFALGFCMGCYIYTYLVLPFFQIKE